jgi:broad-specificity NMP kinase
MLRFSNKFKQNIRAEYGKLQELITEDLIQVCKQGRHIAILGPAGSGKVSITKNIAEKLDSDYTFSDDYVKDLIQENDFSPRRLKINRKGNYKESIYHMLENVRSHNNLVYAGMGVPRLLRAGLRDYNYVPDIVIVVECNEITLEYSHTMRGDMHKLKNNLAAHKGNQKVLREWNDKLQRNLLLPYPTILKIDTSIY